MAAKRCETCDGEGFVCAIHGMQSACDCEDPELEPCDECFGDGEVEEEDN